MGVVAVDDVGDAVRALVEGAGTRRRHLTAIPGGVRSLV
jgi:hypothetical protein